MNEVELANLTPETEKASNQAEENPETNLNPCQGYKVDPVSKLHLCQSCAYHRYRNEARP